MAKECKIRYRLSYETGSFTLDDCADSAGADALVVIARVDNSSGGYSLGIQTVGPDGKDLEPTKLAAIWLTLGAVMLRSFSSALGSAWALVIHTAIGRYNDLQDAASNRIDLPMP